MTTEMNIQIRTTCPQVLAFISRSAKARDLTARTLINRGRRDTFLKVTGEISELRNLVLGLCEALEGHPVYKRRTFTVECKDVSACNWPEWFSFGANLSYA